MIKKIFKIIIVVSLELMNATLIGSWFSGASIPESYTLQDIDMGSYNGPNGIKRSYEWLKHRPKLFVNRYPRDHRCYDALDDFQKYSLEDYKLFCQVINENQQLVVDFFKNCTDFRMGTLEYDFIISCKNAMQSYSSQATCLTKDDEKLYIKKKLKMQEKLISINASFKKHAYVFKWGASNAIYLSLFPFRTSVRIRNMVIPLYRGILYGYIDNGYDTMTWKIEDQKNNSKNVMKFITFLCLLNFLILPTKYGMLSAVIYVWGMGNLYF